MVKLGDEVRDKVSGFTGIAVSKHTYLNGCDRFSVQPKLKKGEDKLPDTASFDAPQLEVLKTAAVDPPTPITRRTGGPEKYMPRAKSTG